MSRMSPCASDACKWSMPTPAVCSIRATRWEPTMPSTSHAVWGLPAAVVDGRTPGDLTVGLTPAPPDGDGHHHPAQNPPDRRSFRRRGNPNPTAGPSGDQPVLSADQALDLAHLALRIEGHYNAPQDIEWAIDRNGRLFILQCRPLQWTPPPGRPRFPASRSGLRDPAPRRGNGQQRGPGPGRFAW